MALPDQTSPSTFYVFPILFFSFLQGFVFSFSSFFLFFFCFVSLFWKTGNYQRLPLAGKARAKIPSLFSVEDICIFFHEEDSRHYDEHALLNKRFWSSILCGSAGKNMLVTLFSFPSCVFVFTNGSSYLYAVIFKEDSTWESVLNSSKGPKHPQSNGQWRFEKKHF